jgi:hypothetical protein
VTLPAEFLRHYTEGFAQLLADDPDLGLTWHPADPYDPAETGIWLAAFPADPSFEQSRAVVLTPYPLGDDAALSDSTIGLQVKTRCPGQDPRPCWSLDDAIANVLLGLYPVTLPTGVQVITLQRTSSASLGMDENQRWTWSSNYGTTVYRPSTHRV